MSSSSSPSTRKARARSSRSTSKSHTPTRITGALCTKRACSWKLSFKAKESRRQRLQDATFDNEFERLRSSVPPWWQEFVAHQGSVMCSAQRAARELLSLHGSLHHLKQRASQTWLNKKCTWGSGRSRRGSLPEGESFVLRNTSSSSMALRMSTMYMKQIIRLGASSEVPDKKDFEEPKKIQGILGKGGKTKRPFAEENIKEKPELSDTLIFQKTTRSSCPWSGETHCQVCSWIPWIS